MKKFLVFTMLFFTVVTMNGCVQNIKANDILNDPANKICFEALEALDVAATFASTSRTQRDCGFFIFKF